MSWAACTVCSKDAREKSEVLALPRRWPTNTVTPMDLSRLRSTFSTSPLRTDTDRPTPSLTATAASVAPLACDGQGVFDQLLELCRTEAEAR